MSDYDDVDEMSVTKGYMALESTTVVNYFAQFGIKVTEADITFFDVPVIGNGTTTAVEYGSSVYLFCPSGNADMSDPTGLTMTVLEGLTAADADIIHLR